jgi:hypothetical protein
MARKVRRGTGMMEREAVSYSATDPAEGAAMGEHLRRLGKYLGNGPDGRRVENAAQLRSVDPGRFPEAAEWLELYALLERLRAAVVPDVPRIIEVAEDMGRLQERIWWRYGRDRATGKLREQLALGKRKQQVALAGGDKGRKTNSARHAEAERWRAVAREVTAAHPGKQGRILETMIVKELVRRKVIERREDAPTWKTMQKVLR